MKTAQVSRRSFIAMAGAVAAHPAQVFSQRVYRLGVLSANREHWDEGGQVTRELARLGFEEGRNLALVERYLNGDMARTEDAAREIVASGVDAILTGGTRLTHAFVDATRSIPIVTSVADPIASGFARSLASPGGNVTGLAYGSGTMAIKFIDIARALVPSMNKLVVFCYPTTTSLIAPPFERAAAAASLALEVVPTDAAGVRSWLESSRSSGGGHLGYAHNYVESSAGAAAALAKRFPLMGNSMPGVRFGHVAAYNQYHQNEERRIAAMVAAVLRGGNPATMPFQLPDSEDVWLNRRSAAILGISIPASLLLRATDVVA